MVNKQGSTTVRLPTSYRSSFKKGKAKNVSIDGNELRRCPNCAKKKLLIKPNYKKDENYYKYSHCSNCQYSNYIPLEKQDD